MFWDRCYDFFSISFGWKKIRFVRRNSIPIAEGESSLDFGWISRDWVEAGFGNEGDFSEWLSWNWTNIGIHDHPHPYFVARNFLFSISRVQSQRFDEAENLIGRKIYNKKNRVIFSEEKSQIGNCGRDNSHIVHTLARWWLGLCSLYFF